jgi:hypothetical protein
VGAPEALPLSQALALRDSGLDLPDVQAAVTDT